MPMDHVDLSKAIYPRSPYPVGPLPVLGPRPRTLIEAIQGSAPLDFISSFVQENPECLNEVGFNGLRPLHKAVLLGNQQVIEFLLRQGADPNCTNNFCETPLLLACRLGFPSVVYYLLQHGADLHSTDKVGRGALQYAALGGSVSMVHFLHTVDGLPLNAVDNKGNTMLHVTATQGHADATMYLLRKQRSDVFATNEGGYTALHCAAQAGWNWICWILMERGGTKLLGMLTHEGYSADDLARKGKDARHKLVYKMLHQYSRQQSNQEIRGPSWLWYWHCIAPFVMYLIALGASVRLNGNLMFLGMAAILVVCAQQKHRIRHVCRWPNPMYAGMFAAGLVLTTSCYLLEVLPTALKVIPLMAYASLVIVIIKCAMYIHLLRLDPGIQLHGRLKDSGEEYTVADVAKTLISLSSFCTACEFVQEPYTKHCKLCEKCHTGMDHHCLFLYKCIAQNNHRQFIRFLMVVMLAIGLFEYQAVIHLGTLYPAAVDAPTDYFLEIFQKQPWICSLMVANGLSVLWGMLLLRFQFKFISLGTTQYFQMSVKRTTNLTYYHRMRNILHFVLGKKYYAKDIENGVLLL